MGVGKKIIKKFINHGEENNFQTITAKVAADIEANKFWDTCGLEIIRQVPGGKTKNRTINERCLELHGNTLFCEHNDKNLKKQNTDFNYPPSSSLLNSTYVIDINILFDLIKNRDDSDSVQHIFSLAFNNDISIAVTSEFSKELDRNTHNFKKDPILEFARSLPTLPEVNDADLDSVISHLRPLIFGITPKTGRFAVNDKSDLRHLASCIHHKMHGFLTREKGILKHSEEIKKIYDIEVLSANDLLESTIPLKQKKFDINTEYENHIISIKELEESNRSKAEEFLKKSGLNNTKIKTTLKPGVQTSKRHRYIAFVDNKIIAIASWDDSSSIKSNFNVNFIVNETSSSHSKITDHLLEKIHRSCPRNRLVKIHLSIEKHQIKTIETAKYRGYKTSQNNSSCYEMAKICFNGIVVNELWTDFTKNFKTLAGIILPKKIPTFSEARNTGFYLKSGDGSNSCILSLHDFETLISPGLLRLDGRPASHVPIKEPFAEELLNQEQIQFSLLPKGENLLHIEKSYFMKANSHKKFDVNGLIIFYVSGAGKGRMESIGIARTIYADTINIEKAKASFSRQGVLPSKVLEEMADKNGMIGIITFDNFMEFKNPIKYNKLKELGCISGANLVTTEKLSKENLDKILNKAFE